MRPCVRAWLPCAAVQEYMKSNCPEACKEKGYDPPPAPPGPAPKKKKKKKKKKDSAGDEE